MIQAFDIIEHQGEKILLVQREQIQTRKVLLKGFLLSREHRYLTQDDWKILSHFTTTPSQLNGYHAQLWNDPVFLIETNQIKKIGSLSASGKLQIKRVLEIQEPLKERTEKTEETLYKLREQIKAVELSLPYKQFVYALSMEEEGETYEHMYLHALKNECKLLATAATIG